MTLAIGWLHDGGDTVETWLHQAGDWHFDSITSCARTWPSATERRTLSYRGNVESAHALEQASREKNCGLEPHRNSGRWSAKAQGRAPVLAALAPRGTRGLERAASRALRAPPIINDDRLAVDRARQSLFAGRVLFVAKP